MVIKRTCVTIQEKEMEEKNKLGVSWRYLINKGIYHCTVCMPKEEELMNRYHQMEKNKAYAHMINYIKENHPDIWDRMLAEGIRTTN